MIRGQFRALRAPDHPELATGVLWIRDCDITNEGTRVTFHLKGVGWQWADQTKKKAGGTFVVRQYVRFAVDAKLPGALDLGYDRANHVVSLWFTPSSSADVELTPVGEVEVDRKSTWASIVGAVGGVFSDSPEEMAAGEAKQQGTRELENQLADGLAVTINVCTGLSRFNLRRQPKGKMQPADVGETKRVPIELQPGGMMIVGPQLAPNGMTIDVEAQHGAVRIALVCANYAENMATAFVANREPSAVPLLGQIDVRTKGKLHIKPVKCPVVVVARPLGDAPVRFAWLRPSWEIARSTGGPLMHCR